MGRLTSLIRKESLHIVRDKRTLFVTVLIPVMLLLLFGFAISTEVSDVRVVAVVDRHDDETRSVLERLCENEYFSFYGVCSPPEAEDMLRKGSVDAILYLKTENGEFQSQVVADASNSVTAQAVIGYMRGVLESGSSIPIITYTLYNPQMKSAYNFVPGILGMIFILICAIMTSVSIVREKETGTMNLLLVSPVRPATIILGKLVPYFILSCVILFMMLLISYTVLGLPVTGNVWSVCVLSILYITLSLSIGLLVSTLVDTQLTALIVSAVVFMLPVIMLSGMIFPIDNMPWPLQWLSGIIPARWYVEAMRKLMVQQLSISYVAREILVLAVMTLILLVLSIRKFTKSSS